MNYLHFSTNGTTWITDLPIPAELKISDADIDDDSYRSVANGNIIRKVVGYKWHKVSFSFSFLTDAQASTLYSTFRNANKVYLKTYGPSGELVIRGYVSQMEWERLHYSQDGWSASFNFIEGQR